MPELVQSTVVAGPGPESADRVQRYTIARMFDSGFLEFFSRVHPAIPALLYVPLIFGLLLFTAPSMAVGEVAGAFAGGLLFWSASEYLLHRFVFHVKRRGPLTEWFYFYFHGIHHLYPDDKWRLVMVPSISIPLAVLFYTAFTMLLPVGIAQVGFAGMVLGYLGYDYSHYATHHARIPKHPALRLVARVMRAQRKHHLRHHFGNHDKGFGVSTPLWDHVFRTFDPEL